jgi:thiamine kinase-like enzyme
MSGYPEFCRRLASKWPPGSLSSLWENLTYALEATASQQQLYRLLRDGLDYGRRQSWPLTSVHGDLSCSNLTVARSGELVLLDWESFSANGLVAADLVRFYYDIALDAKRLPAASYNSLIAKTRDFLVERLQSMGFGMRDFDALEAVFIADQVYITGNKAAPFRPLLDLYLSRTCALTASAGDARR